MTHPRLRMRVEIDPAGVETMRGELQALGGGRALRERNVRVVDADPMLGTPAVVELDLRALPGKGDDRDAIRGLLETRVLARAGAWDSAGRIEIAVHECPHDGEPGACRETVTVIEGPAPPPPQDAPGNGKGLR